MQSSLPALIVGLFLSLLFAAVMALSSAAILVTDFMEAGRPLTDQARQTLVLAAIAGGIAALLAWVLQNFVAGRRFFSRLVYAVPMYAVVFFAVGGLLVVMSNSYGNPNPQGWSLSELYTASVSGFYSFALFIFAPPRIAFFGLLVAGGLILALVGPRRRSARDRDGWR
jgi:hypothetical protein